MLFRTLTGLGLMILLSGCVSGPGPVPLSSRPICDGTRNLRPDHAAALVRDGGPVSQRTGAALIAAVDAGCASVDD